VFIVNVRLRRKSRFSARYRGVGNCWSSVLSLKSTFARLILSIVAIAGGAPGIAHADALQQQVLAAAKAVSPADFAFTQSVRFERTGVPAKQFIQRYDPRRGASAWTLIKVDDRAPTEKERKDLSKMAARGKVPSYAQNADWFAAPATRIATTPTSVTYRFTNLPKGSIKMGPMDTSANTIVEAVVNTAGRVPFIEKARFTSAKPFRMMMVAKVERFVITATNRLTPDGRPVPETTATEFTGSLMGSAQTLRTRTLYSDVTPAR